MGKSAPKAPEAPDPWETAEAQYTFNTKAWEDVFRQGTINQNTPTGSVTYTRDANGLPTGQTTSLSPLLQSAFGDAFNAAGSQLGLLPTSAFNPNVNATGLRDAYVSQGIRNVEDLWNRQDAARNTTYAERGIPLGSELFNTAEREVMQGRNQYLGGLTDAAWQAAATEEQRQLQNQLTQYGLPATMAGNFLNLAGGILGMAPGANPLPIQTLQPGQYADTANRNYQMQMANYNQQLANQSAGLGSFLQFGGNLLGTVLPFMLSDERAKEDIEPVGELHDEGQEPLPIYEYSYKGDPTGERHRGPMAQEMAETNPEAVFQHPDGYLMVNYAAPTRPSLAAALRTGMVG
jgi:hypothetical protein